MKETVVAVQMLTYGNKAEVVVVRQPDAQHLGHVRKYTADWSNPEKVLRLTDLYTQMLVRFTYKVVGNRLHQYNGY